MNAADRDLAHQELDRAFDAGLPFYGEVLLRFQIQYGKLHRIESTVSRAVLAETLRNEGGAK